MNIPLFLYNFAKVYVPGAIVLCLIFAVTNHFPKQNLRAPIQPQVAAPRQQLNLPKNPPPAQAKIDRQANMPAKPSYTFVIELSSGGSMKAKAYDVKGNLVTIFIDDGYEVQLSKKDIKSIKRIKL